MRTVGYLEQVKNFRLFVKHVGDVRTIRALYESHGDGFSLFGGAATCSHAGVTELMKQEPRKVPWFYGPIQEREDYFSAGYMPFLQKGDDHTARRASIFRRVDAALSHLDELDALLDQDSNVDRCMARYLFKHLGHSELSDAEFEDLAYYRKWAAPMVLLPAWFRRSAMMLQHGKLIPIRDRFRAKLTQAGVEFPDSTFDMLWFNTATLGFYPTKAIETLQAQPRLVEEIRSESSAPPLTRKKSQALIHEMLRIHSKIASVNYEVDGEVKIAVIATATVDPVRYERPLEVDLSRDHSDAVSFAGPSPTRSCPGASLAPAMMACAVARHLRR
jgi:hypothetical protein